VTIQALAAVLGGTQSLHTNAKDEALALPTEDAAKLALRTQQIIAYESGVADVADPLAGSYYVESLTDALVVQARELIAEVDALGGAVAAIESGWMQTRIADSAYRAQQEIESGAQVVVGVNRFAEPDAQVEIDLQRIDPKIEREQVARLEAYRAERDAEAVAAWLAELRRSAEGDDNLMPRLLEAVDTGATIGEICDVLRSVFGRYAATEVVA